MKNLAKAVLCSMICCGALAGLAWAQTEGEVSPADTAAPEAAATAAEEPAPAAEAPAPPAAPTPAYGWNPEMVGQVNLAQNKFHNWTPGGEDSLAWQLNLSGKYDNDQADYNWANSGKVAYGQIQVGNEDLKKSVDDIRLESVFSYKLKIHVNPYVAVKGETQLTAGYDYEKTPAEKISKFLDPGYFTESIGVGYAHDKLFKTRLGFAAKQTVADAFAARYSDDPDTTGETETLRNELGLESVTDFNLKVTELIVFTSKLEVFSNLKATDQIDVRWDNTFTAGVAKYLNVALNVQLWYDKDIHVQRQIKQALTLGLTYTFVE